MVEMAQGWCPAGWLRVVSPRLAPHIRDKTPQNLRRMQRRTTWSQAPRVLVGKGGGRPWPRWGQDGGHARPSWIFGNSGGCRRGLQLSCVQRARSPPAPGGKALSLRDEIQPQTGGTWPGWPLGPSRGTRAQRRKGALSPFQRRGRLRPMGHSYWGRPRAGAPGERRPPARRTLGGTAEWQLCRAGPTRSLADKDQVRTSISLPVTFPALKGPVKHGRKLTCQGDRWRR